MKNNGKASKPIIAAHSTKDNENPTAPANGKGKGRNSRAALDRQTREVSDFHMQNPNPVMRLTREGKLLFANPASAPLLESWKQAGADMVPQEIQELLPKVLDQGRNQEIELANQGHIYSCLLVPLREAGDVNLYFNDVTERKQAQDSLQALIHQTSTGITRTSLDGSFLFVNQAFCTMLGYSESELIGRKIWEISHPDDVARNQRLFERLVKEGEPFQLEKRLLRRNGSIVWVSVGSSPLRDEQGDTHSAVSMIVDITRRKRAEETLVDSARRTLYLSSLSDAIRSLTSPAQIEQEGARTLGLNLKASRVAYAKVEADGTATVRSQYTDRAPEFPANFPLGRYIPQEVLSTFRAGRAYVASTFENSSENDKTHLATEEPGVIPAQILVPLIRHGELIAALIVQQFRRRDWRNEEIHVVEETAERMQTAIDRARAERDLRESEKRFRVLANTVPSMVWSTAPDGSILYLNDLWHSYTGLTWEQSVSRWTDALHPEDYERCLAAWRHSLTTGEDYAFEVRYRRYDGEFRWFQCQAIPTRDDQGQIIAWYGVSTDVHERKRTEQEIQRLNAELRSQLDEMKVLLNILPTGVWIGNEDCSVITGNPAAYRMLGLPHDINASVTSEHPEVPADLQMFVNGEPVIGQDAPMQRVARSGISMNDFEHEIIIPNEKATTVYANIVPLFDEKGAVRKVIGAYTDVTERKRAEEQLRESEERYRALVSQTTAGIAQADIESRLLFVNPRFCEMLGYAESELLGKTIWELTHTDDLSENLNLFRNMLTSGESYQFEKRFIRKDGSAFWVNVSVTSMYDAAGKPVGASGVVIDIDQRKRVERTLKQERELLQRLFEAIPVMISMYDPGTGLQRVNRQFQQLTGWGADGEITPQELVTQCYPDPAYRQEVLQRMIASAPNEWTDVQMRTRDKRTLDTTWSNIKFDNGVQVGIGIDVTERRNVEQALRASEEKYRDIVQTANEGIWEIDGDTRTLFVNPHMAAMLGYTPEEMIGRSVFEFVLPEDQQEGEARLERAKQGVAVRGTEFRYRRKDGSIIWMMASTTPKYDNQGSFSGSVAMLVDITERRQHEESLVEYARRQTALYTLADQLNNIQSMQDIFDAALNAILNALQCDRASILLFDETKIMHFVAWRGLSDAYRAATDGHSPWKYGEQNPTPIPMDDVRSADLSDSLRAVISNEGIGALAFIPLVFQETLIGKFMVYFNTPHTFTESELGLGVTIAHQLASAVDRQRNADALRQSEERFARFMQYLPGLAWIKDRQGRYVYANSAAEKAFGTPQEKLYGKSDYEIFSPETATPFQQNDQQALREGKSIQVVETLLQEDGVVHHSLVTKFPIPAGDGTTALIGGTAFDITERVQMEEALRKSRKYAEETADRLARLQQVTASLAGSSIQAQLAERVLEQGTHATGAAAGILVEVINEQELKTIAALGYPSTAIRMDPVPLSLPTPLSDCIRTKQAIWIRSHEEYTAQYPALAESRRAFGNQATVALPLLAGDRVVGGLAFSFAEPREFQFEERGFFLAVAQQCAQGLERVRAEEALRESEERYSAIVNQATAGIVRKDPSGNMLFVNQAFCDMLGYTEEELVGKTMWQFTHQEDVAESRRLFERLMKEGTPFQLEKRLLRQDGSLFWATVSVSPALDSTGKPQYAVSVYADITDRKQAESRLELLAGVSDLIRNLEEPSELMSAVAQIVGKHLQVQRCLFNEIDVENDLEIVYSDYHDATHSVAGVHQVSEYSSVTSAEMEAGVTVVNYDSKTDPRTAPDYERSYVPNGERAYVTIPLMRDDRWVASLWVSDNQPRRWSKEEISLLQTIAERTWTATEKLRINTALRDSEERLRVTFNTTAVGFATMQLDTRFVEVNDAFCNIVGYTREELLAMNVDSLTHLSYIQSTRDRISQLIAGEMPSFVLEKVFIRKDGTPIWVQDSVSLVRNEDGNPLHLISICQDVTERKEADEKLQQLNAELEERVLRRTAELQSAYEFLRESEATARLILESMPDAIVITDPQGQIVYGNAQIQSLFGYRPQEVIGQPVEMLIPQRFHDNHLLHRGEYGKHPQRRYMGLGRDLFGQRKDSSEFPVDVMLSPISNSTNWDVMITIRDNTEQKQAQEALRMNEEKLRKLFEVLPVGISFLDSNRQITEMNSALTEILGLSKQQLLENNYQVRRYIRADGSPMPSEELASERAYTEQTTIYNVETGIVKPDGETIWTSVNAAPVDVADVDVVVATVDITERKKSEEALHNHRERLRILSRRLVEVQEEERRAIARELHDRVGQNLAALNLNLNILRSQLSDEALQIIGTRLDDSVSLVNQILTITRNVMADLRSNVLDDYGLESALREFAEQFAPRTGIQVVTDKSTTPIPRLDPSIEMTMLRIAQEALTNVARHAQAHQATITVNVEADTIAMSIQDDGIGILSWQKANQPGSHGLRIMRERAEAFGGSLQVHSTYKKGTRIEVKIPLASANPSKPPREKQP